MLNSSLSTLDQPSKQGIISKLQKIMKLKGVLF